MDPLILEHLSNAIKTCCTKEDSSIGRAFADHAVQVVKNSLGESTSKSRPLDISFMLNPEMQALLKKHFPGRDIKFSCSNTSQHSFAAAHRVLETDYVYGLFPPDASVVDLGGNFSNHFRNRRNNVHCCCPVLDIRDGARHTERIMSLTKYAKSHPNEVVEPSFCRKKFQDCDIPCDYVMAIHSTSDIPLGELCMALRRKGVLKMVLTIMLTPEMLYEREGYIPHFGVRWTVDRTNDIIVFDFEGASHLGYTHKYSSLIQYLRYNAVIVGDSAYRVERVNDFNGVMVIDITYADGWKPSMPDCIGRSCAWFNSLKDKLFIDVVEPGEFTWERLERRVVIDRKVLTRVIEAAFRQYKPDTLIENAVQNISMLLSSSTNHVIINGVTVVAGTPLDPDDFIEVATSIYYYVKVKYNNIRHNLGSLEKKSMSLYTSLIADDRDLFSSYAGPARLLVSQFIEWINGEEVEQEIDGVTHVVNAAEEFRAMLFGFFTGRVKKNYNPVKTPLRCVPLSQCLEVKHGKFADVMPDVTKKFQDYQSHVKYCVDTKKTQEDRVKKAILKIADYLEMNPAMNVPISGLGTTALVPAYAAPVDREAKVNSRYAEINEGVEYLRSMKEIGSRNMAEITGQSRGGTTFPRSMFYGRKDLWIYKITTKSWICHEDIKETLPPEQYSVGYTHRGKFKVSWVDGGLDTNTLKSLGDDKAIFFDDTCVVDNIDPICESMIKSLSTDNAADITIVDGVAGCGKTTKIISLADVNAQAGCLILTANATSAQELRAKVEGPPLVKSRCVRTMDSYLMSKVPLKADTVFIDEGFMMHSGMIYAALTLAEATKCFIFGDTEQIPFISRNPLFRMKYLKIKGARVVECCDTFRSPQDATYLLNKFFYKKKKNVKTTSKFSRSVSRHSIGVVSEIPIDTSAHYYCYSKNDKAWLKDTPGYSHLNIKTIHEGQGESVDNVIFFRLSTTSTELTAGKSPALGKSHALVALSRHKKTFRYYNRAALLDTDDILYNACGQEISEADLLDRFTLSERIKLDFQLS